MDDREAKIQAKMDRIKAGTAGGVMDEQKFDAFMAQKAPKINSQTELDKPVEQLNRIPKSLDEASSEKVESSADVLNDEQSDEKDTELPENTSEQSEELASELVEEDNSEEQVPEEQLGVKNYAAKKINKLTAKYHGAQEELQELRQKLQELQSRQAVELPVSVPQVTDYEYIDPQNTQIIHRRPKAEEYGQNTPAYIEAMQLFEAGKKNALVTWQSAQKQILEDQRADQIFVQNLQETQKKNIYKDFDKVVTVDKLNMIDSYQPMLSKALKVSPNVSHLLYGICKNPEIMQGFLTANPVESLVELGKMESEMERAMKPNVVSKLPPPIQNKPSSGARKAHPVSQDASQKSQKEWNASIKERMRRNK